MVVYDVMRRPHPLMRRHGHHELAAGPELGGDRGDRSSVVGDMLDHVEGSDQVVMCVRHAGDLR